jgi:hypothetical protein
MNSKVRAVLNVALYLYAALCGLLIYSWPLNKYEWMLDEPDAASEGLTFCSLPLDNNAGSAPVFSFIAIFVFASAAVVLSLKRKSFHPALIIALLLLLLWIAKFFLFAPQC